MRWSCISVWGGSSHKVRRRSSVYCLPCLGIFIGTEYRERAYSCMRMRGFTGVLLRPAGLLQRKDIFHDSESQPTLFMTLRANLHFS
eukprot:COSAG01_NODE_2573_length_7434_cov_7.930207_2_plen_87_part_00